MNTEKLRMRLSIMRTKGFKTKIEFKSKKIQPFVAIVKDFLFDEDDTKVVFIRCEETRFPNDTEIDINQEYSTYIKNLKSVDRYDDEKS